MRKKANSMEELYRMTRRRGHFKSIEDAEQSISKSVKAIKDCFHEVDELFLFGFGTLYTKIREERAYIHPATGEEMLAPSIKGIYFKPSKTWKKVVNKKKREY
ncbi:MAG: HU family DNA-binding protein [Fusobacteriaceae bacterium]